MKKYRGVFLKNEREIGLLREANRMVAMILDELGRQVRPGLPTMHFEEIVQNMCREFKVKPAFQGMYGFPYGLCCSVNEVIVHGFPSEDVILKEGDIVSFDVGTVYEGFYGDAARTFAVGDVSPEAARLLRVTEERLALAVAEARSGNELNDLSLIHISIGASPAGSWIRKCPSTSPTSWSCAPPAPLPPAWATATRRTARKSASARSATKRCR